MVRIICEGKGDIKNLKAILNFLEIPFRDETFIYTNGKSFLLDKSISLYKTLLGHIEDGFVDKILFVVDVDDYDNNQALCGRENTINRIEQLQKDLNVSTISEYYLACDPNTQKGYFESLLLSTVDDKVKKCYEDFRVCSKINSKSVDKNILTELHNLTKPEKPYDFTHQNFNTLKTKLQNLFKGTE